MLLGGGQLQAMLLSGGQLPGDVVERGTVARRCCWAGDSCQAMLLGGGQLTERLRRFSGFCFIHVLNHYTILKYIHIKVIYVKELEEQLCVIKSNWYVKQRQLSHIL